MNRRSKTLLTASLLACLAGVAGCGPDYERTDITNPRPSPLGGRVDRSRIEVPAGMVITAHIIPYDDDQEIMPIDLRSRDTGILEVAGVITEHDYAFFGLRPGTTQIELRADNRLVLVIDAVVTEQPAP